MSLSLKHIPCPAGNTCTAFQCIFGHESDREKVEATNGAEKCATEPQKYETASSSDQDRPRKRFKVNTHESTSSVGPPKAGVGSLDHMKQKAAVSQKQRPAVRKPASTNHPARDSLTTVSASSRSLQSALKIGDSLFKTASPPKLNKETLNPRLLKNSPASHEIRLKLLKLTHQELKRLNTEMKKDASGEEMKLVLSEQELIVRALDEERLCAVEKPAVYSNVMKNKIMQYKRTSAAQWKETRAKELQAAQKKRRQSEISDGEPKKFETGLASIQEVLLLKHILTPIDSLSSHGYVPTIPSEEHVKAAREGLEAAKGWEKCDRCQQRFQVFPGRREEDGALTTGGACNFHWGKAYVPDKLPGDRTRVPKRYHCCGQEVGDSVGCSTYKHHVFKASDPKRLAAILNFAETPENSLAPADRAVCFDCEMCYTVNGLELVRLTATSWPAGEDLLDILVQPLGEILDLNSRFSGVWPEDVAQALPWSVDDDFQPSKSGEETGSEDGELKSKKKLKIVSSPEVARDLLFSLISPSTPLIGHGLENDLNAVRIIHPTIIDTVLLYPHKMGLPYRHGLKSLMNVHLNRKIQQETGPKMLGHDSGEDARSAGDLVRLRIMDKWKDMQRKGWGVVGGELTPQNENGKAALTEEFIEGQFKPA